MESSSKVGVALMITLHAAKDEGGIPRLRHGKEDRQTGWRTLRLQDGEVHIMTIGVPFAGATGYLGSFIIIITTWAGLGIKKALVCFQTSIRHPHGGL